MDIGTELRSGRLQRGLTLQQVADRTKISLPILRALEGNDADRLPGGPGGIFARGFVKSYAREVGLDADEVVARYSAQFPPPPPPPEPPARTRVPRVSIPQPTGRVLQALRLAGLTAVALAYIVVVGQRVPVQSGPKESQPSGAAVHALDKRQAPTEGQAATSTVGSSEPAALPAATSGSGLHLDLQVLKPCWVSATADGRQVVYRLMGANDRESIQADNEMLLRIGEPGNVRVSVNGVPAKLPPAGRPATLRISTQNFRTFAGQ